MNKINITQNNIKKFRFICIDQLISIRLINIH